MPKNKISDPITDQEIAFARLFSGAMTDRHAAEAVGLNPDSAAYTKSKPRVRAYMLEHRAAVQQQLVQQEADATCAAANLDREQVLDRLWEIANLSPEMTRDSITGQVKALSMIVAMQNFIPDRLAVSSEKKSAPAAHPPANQCRRLALRAADHNYRPATPCTSQKKMGLASPPVPPARRAAEAQARSRLGRGGPPGPGPSRPTFANRFTPSEAPRTLCPPVRLCSRLESSFLYKRTPLSAPAELPILKRAQKYRILQMTEQAAENS